MRGEGIEVTPGVQELRQAQREQVGRAVEELIAWVVESAGSASSVVHRFDRELHPRLMALGLALVGLWLVHRVPEEVPSTLRTGRGWYRLVGLRGAPVRTQYGEWWWMRPLYELVYGKGERTVAPCDRQAGLAAGRMSLTVHLMAANMAARMSYEAAKEVTEIFGHYAPSTRSMQGIVGLHGPSAARHMRELPAPTDDGELLYIELDGAGVAHITEQEHQRRCMPHTKQPRKPGQSNRPRGASRTERKRHRRLLRKDRERKKVGDKSKNARMATIGVVYTQRVLPDGSVEGPLNRRVFGTFDGPKALAKMVKKEAVKRGYGRKETVFLADGAPHLWKIWRKHFPLAKPCLDWFHLCEYLWDAAAALYRANSPKRREWVSARQDALMRGEIDAVVDLLLEAERDALDGASKKRRKKLKKVVRYLRNHREMMRHYADLSARDLTYATGIVEGTIKHLRARLDSGSPRWSIEGSANVLALRCVLLSGEWAAFEEVVCQLHEAVKIWDIPRVTRASPRTPHISGKKAA